MRVCLLEEDLVFHWPTVSQQESNREERRVTGRAEVHFRSISLTSGWSGHIRLIMFPIYLSIHHSKLFKLRKHSRTLYFIKVGHDSDLVAKRRTWEEDGTDTQKYRFFSLCGSSGSTGYKYPTYELPCVSDSVASCVWVWTYECLFYWDGAEEETLRAVAVCQYPVTKLTGR